MKRKISGILFVFLLLASTAMGGVVWLGKDIIIPWNMGPSSDAQYFISLNGSIVPENGAEDLGNGTFTNADGTNRNYFDPDNGGYLTAAGVNEARFEKISGDRWKSLLVEPAGTNSILQSRTFTNASWVNNTVATADKAGIDGVANTACTIEDADSGQTKFIRQNLAIADDTNTHTIYVLVGKDSNTSRFPALYCYIYNGGASQNTLYTINTSTGDYYEKSDTNNDDDGGVIDMADYGLEGWWLLWITDTNDGSGNVGMSWIFYPAYSATIDGAADTSLTDTCVIDQAQVELNQAFPSRPIITTTTAVSRTSEAGYPTYTLPSGVFNADGCCVFWLMPGFAETSISADCGLISTNASAAMGVFLDVSGNGIGINDGTTEVTKALSYSMNTWYKVAWKWDVGGNHSVTYDSGSGLVTWAAGAFDGVYTAGAKLSFGDSLQGPIWIKNAEIFTRILTDSEIDSGGSP